MPRRLDPAKGLPGLFQSKTQTRDMGFLVRAPESAEPAPKKKPARRRAAKKTPEVAPELSGASGTVAPTSAEVVVPVAAVTSATDAIAMPTATSSVAVARPNFVLTPEPEPEARAALLLEAAPPCRVPEADPERPRLAWSDSLGFARCAIAWAIESARAALAGLD